MSTAILEIRDKMDGNQVPQLLDEERAAMSLAHCSVLVAAVDRAAHIDDVDKAALGELAKQVQWEAIEAETIELAFSGNKRKKMQHEQDEASGRDLEALQEAAYPEKYNLTMEWKVKKLKKLQMKLWQNYEKVEKLKLSKHYVQH